MAIDLTVDNTTFSYPEPGDPKGWGEDATGWAQAVTTALDRLLGIGDILEGTFPIGNGVSTPAEVSGLLFDTGTVRGAFIEYTVYRVTDSSEIAEVGTMNTVFKNVASDWTLSRTFTDDAGMTFTITAAGQVKYTSTTVSGPNYVAAMQFQARGLSQ